METLRISFSGILIMILSVLQFGCGPGIRRKELSDRLRLKIEMIQNEAPVIDGKLIYNPDLITLLYMKGEGLLSSRWDSRENISEMISAIRNSRMEGLNPEDYHLAAIEQLADKIAFSDEVEIAEIARLEIFLTDALLLLSEHLSGGKVNSETIDPQWRAVRRTLKVDLEGFIDSTLRKGRITESLRFLTPQHREYHNLKLALEKYRQIEENGGWEPFLSSLSRLETGIRHPDVAVLRNRLSITQGKIEPDSTDADIFDQSLHDQVILFQLRHGLTPDGIVGKATIEALNITVTERISTIEANLERWRWLSDDLGSRYLRVNIANFVLEVIESDQVVFSSEAIVGRPYRKTPVFSSLMTYLVFNPDWIIPPTILHNDLIPSVIKNPSYLSERNMKVLRSDGTEVDPASIDWRRFQAGGFQYRIRQAPGPDNALGRVKFMFPNQHNVYIHDTPTRNLFFHTDRSFSSGCIRISKPFELAEYLLKDAPGWTPLRIREVISQGRERRVDIPNPIRVHLLYHTAWATDDGTVFFRRDIYERDSPLIQAMRQSPPPGSSMVAESISPKPGM